MNSSYFEDKMRFLPDGRNVKDKCEKRQVLPEENRLRRKGRTMRLLMKKSTSHEEWMMACVTHRKEDNTKVEYYLSRAYSSSKLFVYAVDKVTGDMILENLGIRVRNVIDNSRKKILG